MPKALILVGISGSRVGKPINVVGQRMVLGSGAGCDLVLHDRQILPRHAEIRQSLNTWFITPLSPDALVAVNGKRISAQGRVSEGDLVTVGSVTFKATISETNEVGGRR
jgi:predicted component of type VI protein secretion system